MFVPEDDYFEKKFNELFSKLEKKTGFDVKVFESLKVDPQGLQPVTYTFLGQTYVFTDFKFLNENIGFIRSALSFLLNTLLFLFMFNSFTKLVRGFGFLSGGGKSE